MTARIASSNREVAAFKSDMEAMVGAREVSGEQAIGFEIQKARQIYDANFDALQELKRLPPKPPRSSPASTPKWWR